MRSDTATRLIRAAPGALAATDVALGISACHYAAGLASSLENLARLVEAR